MQLTAKQILRYSPYEETESGEVKSQLTEEVFNKELYVPQDTEIIERELSSYCSPTSLSQDVVILHGFSGNGKTTFVRNFSKKYSDVFKSVILDCSIGVLPSSIETPPNVRDFLPLKSAFVEECLKRDPKNLCKFIIDNHHTIEGRPSLFTQFTNEFQSKVNLYLLGEQNVGVYNKFEAFLKDLELTDLCQVMFINYFLNISSEDINAQHLFFFDNLDRLNLEHIAYSFAKKMLHIRDRCIKVFNNYEVAKTRFDFKNKVKFIFILRDANYAFVNPHFRQRVDLKDIPISLKNAKKILDARIAYIKKSSLNKSESDFFKTLQLILKDGSYIVKNFLPVFNLDYRQLIGFLIELITEDIIKATSAKFQDKYIHLVNSKKAIAHRGVLFFSLISLLAKKNFLTEFKQFSDSMSVSESDGLCNPYRVFLTVLLNMNEFGVLVDAKMKQDIHLYSENKPITLMKLLKKLDKIYHVDLIFDIVRHYFLSTEKDWCNVISMHLNPLRSEYLNKNSECEFKDYLEYYKKLYKEYTSPKSKINNGVAFEELNALSININPTGFSYINQLIVHYEYYALWAKQKKPLFYCVYFDHNNNEFEFETNIRSVLELVKKHVHWHSTFFKKMYTRVILENGEKLNGHNFCNSVYAYNSVKHDLELKETIGNIRSEFHSTRVVSHHIRYIDEFRVFLLNDLAFAKWNRENVLNIERFSNKYTSDKINEILVGYIEDYISIFKESADPTVRERLYLPLLKQVEFVKTDYSNHYTYITKTNT